MEDQKPICKFFVKVPADPDERRVAISEAVKNVDGKWLMYKPLTGKA